MCLAKSESTIERILMVIRLQQFVTWQGLQSGKTVAQINYY